jgi:integrase
MPHARQINGREAISIKFEGVTRTEYLGLFANKENHLQAKKWAKEIGLLIARGGYTRAAYLDRFPNSKRFPRTEPAPEVPTLRTFAAEWLTKRKPFLTPAACADYKSQLDFHILTHAIADKRLDVITDTDTSNLVSTVHGPHKKPLGPRRINLVLSRLITILHAAVKAGHVPATAVEMVEKLQVGRTTVDPFEEDEIRAIIRAASGWERNLITDLFTTRIRPGEALALNWNAIDSRRNQFHIQAHPKRFGGAGNPKTPDSDRWINMGAACAAALKSWSRSINPTEAAWFSHRPRTSD